MKKTAKSMKKIIAILVSALILASCNPNRIYSEYKELPEMTWEMNNVVNFDVAIEDANVAYDIKIDLRTVDFYQFSNLWLYINTESPSNKVLADTMECRLYDDKGFSMSDKMKFGEVEDYEFKFKENVKFAEKGTYKFNIQHGMRMESLPFVREIGLIIEKHQD